MKKYEDIIDLFMIIELYWTLSKDVFRKKKVIFQLIPSQSFQTEKNGILTN